MMFYEERERIRARLSGWLARWLGITCASDTQRLLAALEATENRARTAEGDAIALRHNLTRAQQIIALLRADLHHVKTQLFKRDLPPPTYVWRQQAHQPHSGDEKQ